jgi:hypothetical protein
MSDEVVKEIDKLIALLAATRSAKGRAQFPTFTREGALRAQAVYDLIGKLPDDACLALFNLIRVNPPAALNGVFSVEFDGLKESSAAFQQLSRVVTMQDGLLDRSRAWRERAERSAKGSKERRERGEKRRAMIHEQVCAGNKCPKAIYDFIKGEDETLLYKNKKSKAKGGFISVESMMKDYTRHYGQG